MRKNKHKIVSFVAGAMAVGAVMAPSFAFAQTSTSTDQAKTRQSSYAKLFTKQEMTTRANAKGVTGTVVSVSGATITLTDKKGTTYTVDTTNAKFAGEGLINSFSLANIVPNDKISVRGTISGTTIVATSVSDTSYIARTVFSGKVTAVSGSTITLVKNKNVTYTVDVGSATLTKGFGKNAKTISATDVVVGDRLTVNGTLSGTTISANSIDDMGTPVVRQSASLKTAQKKN